MNTQSLIAIDMDARLDRAASLAESLQTTRRDAIHALGMLLEIGRINPDFAEQAAESIARLERAVVALEGPA